MSSRSSSNYHKSQGSHEHHHKHHHQHAPPSQDDEELVPDLPRTEIFRRLADKIEFLEKQQALRITSHMTSAPSSEKSIDSIDAAQLAILEQRAPLVPYGEVCGVTIGGVPCFSNGDEDHFSGEPSLACHHTKKNHEKKSGTAHHRGVQVFDHVVDLYHQLGIKWQCVEFSRRFLLMTRGVWLRSVPVAELIWNVPHLTNIITGAKVRLLRFPNGSRDSRPVPGDILIWQRAHDVPFGHVAVVVHVTNSCVQIAEQNEHFHHWQGRDYGRTLPVSFDRGSGAFTVIDEDPIIGWMRADAPLFDFAIDDAPDAFRHIISRGSIKRVMVPTDVSLAWLQPNTNPCDFFLKRSLVVGGELKEGAVAAEGDVPSAYYVLDYDMWCRIRAAALSLHELAMESTWHVITHNESEHLLENHFGIPRKLHGLLRRSAEAVPPMFGRFDFGYDGDKVVMLEYNCDSSAALLECMRTQGQWSRHHQIDHIGHCSGSFIRSKIIKYLSWLATDPAAAAIRPSHGILHFMIDNDDEERYTALCVMQCAEEVGFKCKLCVKLTDFRFQGESQFHPQSQREQFLDDVTIVDLEGAPVELVWKTWSWDTVLHQYAKHVDPANFVGAGSSPSGEEAPPHATAAASARRPTLSDMLLNAKITVLEPLWKAVAGSKAILPVMYRLNPDHENMVRASFSADKNILAQPYLTKPVNGRAGQNITMYDAEEVAASSSASPPSASGDTTDGDRDTGKESSSGKFYDSLLVYQSRCFLRPFDGQHYPIFCGWMVGEGFGGIVIREDTSKITKLNSVVVPCRVVRQ